MTESVKTFLPYLALIPSAGVFKLDLRAGRFLPENTVNVISQIDAE